jgi:AAA domain
MSEVKAGVMPFNVIGGLDVVSGEEQVFTGLVGDLLADVGLTMMCAKPKIGKSTLARQLAVSVAEGHDFLGKPVKTGSSLYLSLEGPKHVVTNHFRTLGLTQSNGRINLVHENMPSHGELGVEKLRRTLDALKDVRLLVIDPVGKLLRLAKSENYDEVLTAVEVLETLAKDYRLHMLFLAHAKKRQTDDAGDSPIGSTAFRGGTDCNIFLRKQGLRRIISTEQRWGNPIEEETFLDYDRDRQTMMLGKPVSEEQEERQDTRSVKTRERIERDLLSTLSLISLSPDARDKGATQSQLLDPVQGKRALKLEVLKELVECGRVSEDEDGKSMRYRFVVSQEGKAA